MLSCRIKKCARRRTRAATAGVVHPDGSRTSARRIDRLASDVAPHLPSACGPHIEALDDGSLNGFSLDWVTEPAPERAIQFADRATRPCDITVRPDQERVRGRSRRTFRSDHLDPVAPLRRLLSQL